jgi:hypothetical protein
VFLPEVKKRTRHRVLLLLDNAPGHFEAFERDNVRIVFFPPNCTSWKRPYDMGIIAALKKRFKYLYLKDVLDFYELDEEAKENVGVEITTQCCWSCIRKSNSPARCCELCQRSLTICVTKFYKKCIYQGENNDIRSRLGSSE